MKLNNIRQKAQVLYKQGKVKAGEIAQKTENKIGDIQQGARNLIYKSDLEKLQKKKASCEKRIARIASKRMLAKLLNKEKLVQHFEQKLEAEVKRHKEISECYEVLLKKQSATQEAFEKMNP